MLELATILVVGCPRAGQELVESSTKVAIEHGVDDRIQRRVAVTEPEDDGKHRTRYVQSGQQSGPTSMTIVGKSSHQGPHF